MHPLVLHQLKKHFTGSENFESELMTFLEAVSACYNNPDILAKQLSEDEQKEGIEKMTREELLEFIYTLTNSMHNRVSKLMAETSGLVYPSNDIHLNPFNKSDNGEIRHQIAESSLFKMASDLQLTLIEFDQYGKVRRANQACLDLFKINPENLEVHIRIEKLMPRQVDESLSSRGFETTIEIADGTLRSVLVSSSELKNTDGQNIGSIVALFDIHDRKIKEDELYAARLKAELALDSRKVFLANISHEIRTPINAIVGMSGLLQQGELSPNQKEYVEALKSSAEGLMVLINDLLDVSKVESGKMDLEIISFSLQKLSKNLIKSLGLKAEEKGLQLNWYMDPQVKEWHLGDPTRISQIITNLIGNAIKFTRSGFVKLKISLLSQSEQNQLIQVTIVDSGIGITHDRLPGIFEQFTQEDSSTTRKYGGTGLGLSISRQLVELMGSELHVKSEKGKGSEFYFTLDLPISSANQSETDLHEVPDLSGVDVLVVEDNEINRFLALTIFKNWNANVVTVNNGLEAVDELKLKSYDLVLMDLQMPYMDGFEATRIIRGELKLTIPIIALTANSLNTERESCLQHGMNDYVTKPFQPDQLYRKIRTYLANIRYMQRREKHKAG